MATIRERNKPQWDFRLPLHLKLVSICNLEWISGHWFPAGINLRVLTVFGCMIIGLGNK